MLTPADAARVAVVVVNYGSSGLLARHLAQLTSETPGLQAVVVDNFTTQSERTAVSGLARAHGWTAVLLDENVGYGAGNNRAVSTLRADIQHVVLLNPDASLDPDSLQLLVGHLDDHPDHLVAPLVQRPDGAPWSAGVDLLLATGQMRGWHRRPDRDDPSTYQPWLSGACLALTRRLWDRIGGFDEDYFLYWEDVDLSRRVLDAGGVLTVVAGAISVHDEGSTHRGESPTRAKSPIYYYWNARNRLLYAAKHLSTAEGRQWLRSAPSAGYWMLMQGGRRQLVRPHRTVWPIMRGTWDGSRQLRRRARQVGRN